MMLNAPARQGLLPTASRARASKAGNGAYGLWHLGFQSYRGKKCRKGMRKDNRKWTWLWKEEQPPLGLQLAFEGSWGVTETTEPCYTTA